MVEIEVFNVADVELEREKMGSRSGPKTRAQFKVGGGYSPP